MLLKSLSLVMEEVLVTFFPQDILYLDTRVFWKMTSFWNAFDAISKELFFAGVI